MRNSKKIWLTSLTLLMILLAGYFFFPYPVLPSDELDVVARKLTSTNKNLSITYPQIEGLPDQDIQNSLNQPLLAEARSYAVKYVQPDYSGQVNYTITLNENHILSLTLEEFFYAQRAAHPMTYLRGFTMSGQTGQIYKLDDLFKPDSHYRDRLNEIITRQIEAKKIFLLRQYKGIASNQEFYLTRSELVIFYQLYEYAPYVYGILKFSIPYQDLQGLFREPFASMFTVHGQRR
ncbi:Hypothetical protein LUCI_0534 [Lucifera butyrica]|uniref:DUF3298 domain-containing protein n=1 Tax=Lucifera butyrica TaxID=1351585 RepID=A0A498R3B2_9FIRM|nr:DUF3298 and DUF4163 domain-containing protein [Lucifera butyrica]VBB05327.1 Hypothetical protein LUCI_0534 [Lucifera butyrica]